MGQEIERKYLVNHQKWQQLEKPFGKLFRQGYLTIDPNKTIRVRQVGEDEGYLTIKGKSVGATRAEYEYEIPVEDAKELLDDFAGSELSKFRFRISVGDKVWEVDEFLGDNQGLIIAEIELISEDENFILPDWVVSEVTGQQKYYNSKLTLKPYKTWDI